MSSTTSSIFFTNDEKYAFYSINSKLVIHTLDSNTNFCYDYASNIDGNVVEISPNNNYLFITSGTNISILNITDKTNWITLYKVA